MPDRLRIGSVRAPLIRRLLRAATALAMLAAGCWASAEEQEAASTTAAARLEACRAIPLPKVDSAFRERVNEVVSDPSLFRRMPTSVIDCRPELFTFLAQNPEVLTEIWRHLGVSRIELKRTGDNAYDLRDGAGTTGKLTVVEQSCDAAAQNRIVMFADGMYEGKPFQKPLSAQCVLLLRSGSMVETNGRHFVAARLDTFIKLDSVGLELMAKAVHPFVGQTADRNFVDTLSFVSNLSYTAEKRPQAIEGLAAELKAVDEPRRRELVKLSYECAEAGREWRLSRAEQGADDAVSR